MKRLLLAVAFAIAAIGRVAACEGDGEKPDCSGLEPQTTEILTTKDACGAKPIERDWWGGSGDCHRKGILKDYRIEKRSGVPVRRWSIIGSVSGLEIATGCYCVIDE